MSHRFTLRYAFLQLRMIPAHDFLTKWCIEFVRLILTNNATKEISKIYLPQYFKENKNGRNGL